MFFIIVGVIIIAMNLLDIGPPAAWNWEFTGDVWKFTVPFILAALWWVWADKSGLNKRREMRKMDEKKAKRRRENLANLGLDIRSSDTQKGKGKADPFISARQREIQAVEAKRAKRREENRDSILGSRFDSRLDSRLPDQGVGSDDAKS